MLHRLLRNIRHHLPSSYYGLQIRSVSQKTSLAGISQDNADKLKAGIPMLYMGTFPFFSGINFIIYLQTDLFSSTGGLTVGIIVNSLLVGSLLYVAKNATKIVTSMSVTPQGQLEITHVSMMGRHVKTTHELQHCNVGLFNNVINTQSGGKFIIPWNFIDAEDSTWNEFEVFDKFLTYVKFINPSADVKLCKDFGRVEGEPKDILKEIELQGQQLDKETSNVSKSWG